MWSSNRIRFVCRDEMHSNIKLAPVETSQSLLDKQYVSKVCKQSVTLYKQSVMLYSNSFQQLQYKRSKASSLVQQLAASRATDHQKMPGLQQSLGQERLTHIAIGPTDSHIIVRKGSWQGRNILQGH